LGGGVRERWREKERVIKGEREIRDIHILHKNKKGRRKDIH
jgi:hypothetical protein